MNHMSFFFSHTAGQAFICTALTVTQLCVKWTACICISDLWSHAFVCLHTPRPLHLFPLRLACLRYSGTSVAPGSADVGANATQLFTLNHVGSRQTPCCCCCYGLVPSSYWLLAKLKAGERLIKDTWVCVACQGPLCGFYWLPGLINTRSRRESLLTVMYCSDPSVM